MQEAARGVKLRDPRMLVQSISAVSHNGGYASKDEIGGSIVFPSSVSTRDDAAECGINRGDAMDAEAVCSMGKRDIAAAQVCCRGGNDNDGVIIENVRAHAAAIDAEACFRATFEERATKSGELRRIPFLNGARLPHGG